MKHSIDTKTLQQWLDEGREFRIIDIRNPEQYDAAHIAGSTNQFISVAIKQGRTEAVDDLMNPEGIPIVTVCNQGGSCQLAADLLREKGVEAYALEGGMKSWLEESRGTV